MNDNEEPMNDLMREAMQRASIGQIMSEKYFSDEKGTVEDNVTEVKGAHAWIHDEIVFLEHRLEEHSSEMDIDDVIGVRQSLRVLMIIHVIVEHFELQVMDHWRRLGTDDQTKAPHLDPIDLGNGMHMSAIPIPIPMYGDLQSAMESAMQDFIKRVMGDALENMPDFKENCERPKFEIGELVVRTAEARALTNLNPGNGPYKITDIDEDGDILVEGNLSKDWLLGFRFQKASEEEAAAYESGKHVFPDSQPIDIVPTILQEHSDDSPELKKLKENLRRATRGDLNE